MPIYNYVCRACDTKFEKYVSFRENADLQSCPQGHTQVRRVFTAPAVVFKGNGFYVTDSRPKSKEAKES